MRLLAIILSLIFVLSANQQAFSSQLPRFLGSEKKFRSYSYNPNDVYRYIGHYTYQGFIEFSGDEAISTITMGNPSLWLFEHLGNRLFLKPVGDGASETNMTIITSKRIYQFELTAREASGIDDPNLIFVVKFSYPDDKDKNIMEFEKAPITDVPDMSNLSVYNFNYQYTGDPSIAPIKVFDNGEFTFFQFRRKNAEIPAIFAVDSAGFESLINFRSAADYIIAERVAPQFSLRNGSDIVCVYNNNMFVDGAARSPQALKSPSQSSPAANAIPFQSPAASYSPPQDLSIPTQPATDSRVAPFNPAIGLPMPNITRRAPASQ